MNTSSSAEGRGNSLNSFFSIGNATILIYIFRETWKINTKILMRVISGKLKNIEISFVNEEFRNANATPQKIKKALFSILGENLTGKSFLDLYSGSGQIGFEALSRNARLVVFNEIDKKRYHFISSIIKKWKLEESSFIYNFHAFRCLRYLESKSMYFDCIFIDPPYTFSGRKTSAEDYYNILNEINNIIKTGGIIVVQHNSRIFLKNNISNLEYIDTKKYAKNSLSVFKRAVE